MADVDSQIAELNDIATNAVDKVDNYVADAITASQGVYVIGDPQDVIADSVNVLPWADPNSDLGADLYAKYGNEFNKLVPWLNGLVTDWKAEFFPDECVIAEADAWICNTIANGGTGIPANVEDGIWQRDRDREMESANQLARGAINTMAAMGYSMPNGTLNAALLKVQQDAQDKVVTLSRDVAIKNVEIEIENIRFAVEEAVKLRLGLLNALADFIRAYLQLPTAAAQVAELTANAKWKLWDATASYYKTLLSVAELKLDADKFNRKLEVEASTVDSQAWMKSIDTRTDAAVAAAKAMADQASAALSALNTLSANISTTST